MTIKQVPAKWTDWWTDEPDAAIETTNTTTTTMMMTWTWTLLPVLCRGKALAREATAAVRPMWVSLYLCVCVWQRASECWCASVCGSTKRRQTIHCMQVSRGRGQGSAICDPSCIFTLACTFDHCQHACLVRPVKWAAANSQQSVSSGNKRLVFGAVYWWQVKPRSQQQLPLAETLTFVSCPRWALCLIVCRLWTRWSCKSALKNADATI